jgi:beta-fructofuranosidase
MTAEGMCAAEGRSDHHLFPRYHVRPPVGYMNDPNGPVIHGGLVHLYFQYRFTTDTDSPVVWGHATSPDFVNWTYHRPAILPHPLLGDRDGCYSGNTVVGPDGRIHAFYSGYVKDEPYQLAYTAVSIDDGYSFGAPILAVPGPTEDEQITTYRDPFVWHEDGRWRMVVGAGDANDAGSAQLYSSEDLNSWEHLGVLARLPRGSSDEYDTGDMWECPQVLDIDGQTVIVFGAWARTGGDMRVFSALGPSPDEMDAALRVHPVDAGPDFYAASVLREGPFGPVMWGWAREARHPDWRDADWWGALTLPRTVRMAADGRLLSAPVPTMDALRDGDALLPGSGDARALGAQFELSVDAQPGRRTTVWIGFGDRQSLQLQLDPSNDAVTIDRNRARLAPGAVGGITVVEQAFGTSDPGVRAFVDGSILEVFTSGGRVATVRFYPTTPPPWSVVTDGDSKDLRIWRLRVPPPPS